MKLFEDPNNWEGNADTMEDLEKLENEFLRIANSGWSDPGACTATYFKSGFGTKR